MYSPVYIQKRYIYDDVDLTTFYKEVQEKDIVTFKPVEFFDKLAERMNVNKLKTFDALTKADLEGLKTMTFGFGGASLYW